MLMKSLNLRRRKRSLGTGTGVAREEDDDVVFMDLINGTRTITDEDHSSESRVFAGF